MRTERKGQVKKVLWTIILGVLGIFVYITINQGIGDYALASQGALLEEETERVAKALDLAQSYREAYLFLDLGSTFGLEIITTKKKGKEMKHVKLTHEGKTSSSDPIVLGYNLKPETVPPGYSGDVSSVNIYLSTIKHLCISKKGGNVWVFNTEDPPDKLPDKIDESCGLK